MESPNELIILISVGIGLMLVLAMAFILFFTFSQGKFREEKLKAQEAKLAYQEELLHSNILTQEEERERIAKDLHDEVGSKLNVVHLYLHQLTRKAPEAGESIREMVSVINDTIDTTRRISHDLLPPTLDSFGLSTAVEELCERIQQTSQLEIYVETQGERAEHIEKIVELNLFRILFELLSNTLKYAEASQIHISLAQTESKISLSYRDNGKGFDASDFKHQKGLGMKNIESRLQMIQGSYELKTAPGEGVWINIQVALNPQQHSLNG